MLTSEDGTRNEGSFVLLFIEFCIVMMFLHMHIIFIVTKTNV